MVKPSSANQKDNQQQLQPPSSSSSSCKYTGVRKRKWGKYVTEIRLPNSRDRIWLGSYDTAEKAARAFDAALFCLRGGSAKFNFPDNPPEIPNGRSMTREQIQLAAARYAHSEPDTNQISGRSVGLDSGTDSLTSSEMLLLQRAESPCPSVSDGVVAEQVDGEMTEIPLDNAFLDQFLTVGSETNVPDFGIFPGFDDFSCDFLAQQSSSGVDYYWPENNNEELYLSSVDSFLWNF